jgi:hypothetical protein
MVTTSRSVSLDVVGRDGARGELIHLTGSLQMVARAVMVEPPSGDPVGSAILAQVDLRFDAARVRGVSLKTGARYWAEGVHHFRHQSLEFSAPFHLLCCFELVGDAPADPQPIRLRLSVHFNVTVPADGRVMVTAAEVEPELKPCPSSRSSPRRCKRRPPGDLMPEG